MFVTYADLIQIEIFICSLVSMCYTIFKKKNSRQLPRIVDGRPYKRLS